MKKEDIVGVSMFVIFLVVFGIWYKSKEEKKYKDKGVLTVGTVTDVKDDYKKVPSIYYVFKVGGNSYTGKTAYPEFKANIESELKNKNFPVVYIKDHPEESQIMISRAEFKNQDIPFPDSLAWTIKLEVP